jgi:hypothetical protein
MNETRCSRCHRTLRAKSSIAAGMGPTCAKRARQEAAAAAAGIKADTLAKATEDIDDGAVQPTTRRTSSGHRVYVAISSDGTHRHLATTHGCTCRGGHYGRTCRHRAAAILKAAA